ncbi:MAG: hypothetical protein HN531_09120, partial [Opitutae bacterium]|nr:hypothetical protein [Opitutae bacterium]
MKKLSIFLFLVLGAKGLFADANATLTAAEFFVDTDPGEGSGTALQAADGAFDSEVESIVPKDLNVTGLAVGPHLIGVRFKDNNNTWGEVLFQTIHVYDPNPSGGGGGGGSGGFATIKAAEYFVDTDPGEGNGVAFQAQDGAFDSEVESIVPKDLNVTGLAIGPHLVGVRYQENNNTWGEVLYQTIHVYDPNPAGGGGGGGSSSGFATIKAAEYFVDTDPGEGNGVAFQAQDGAFDSEVESVLPKNLNVTGLAIGPHLVGVRYQENNNTWGEVLFQTIHVYDPNPAVGGGGGGSGAGGFSIITAAEYFIGTDPGEGNATALQPKDGAFDSEVESTLPTSLSMAGYPVGTYLVGVRYRDNNNTWGEVLFKTIEVDVDTDGDGLADKAEIYYETNASIPDTDGDGYLDGEEVAFGSDPTDPNSLGNRAPTGLDFSGLAGILESAPVGTKVGDFNSTDTDANSTLRFALADGNGSTHNNLFSIDANGSLVTAAPLDYETNATLYVRVEALDEHNYSFVRQFVLNVLDVVEDLDQDGIADHLDPDIDGDGFSNAEELAAGTDPHSPASKPTLQTGLVAWFPFDGNANDASGNGNHGTVHGATLGTDRHGRPGKAFGFDGVDDYVLVQNAPSVGQSFSLCSWIRLTRKSSMQYYHSDSTILSNSVTNANYANYALNVFGPERGNKAGFLEFGGRLDSNPHWTASGPPVDDGHWHLVSGTYDGTKKTLYMDGTPLFAQPAQGHVTSGTGKLFIGSWPTSTRFLNGSIDEVRIYDRALSAIEVQALYQLENTAPPPDNNNTSPPGDGNQTNPPPDNNGTNPPGDNNQTDPNPPGDGNASNPTLQTGLVAWFPFDGNANDLSGNGNHGTVHGATLGTDRHGRPGKAYGFDGSANYLSANLSPNLSGKKISISAWVKLLSPAGSSFSFPYVIHAKGGANDETFSIGMESDWIEVWGAGRGLYFSESRRLTPSIWTMLTVSMNENALTYYVNGQLNEATAAGTAKSLNISNISIGCREGNNFFKGSIDEVRIYDRALSAAEVQALYQLENTPPTENNNTSPPTDNNQTN